MDLFSTFWRTRWVQSLSSAECPPRGRRACRNRLPTYPFEQQKKSRGGYNELLTLQRGLHTCQNVFSFSFMFLFLVLWLFGRPSAAITPYPMDKICKSRRAIPSTSKQSGCHSSRNSETSL